MTIPREEASALKRTREFLRRIVQENGRARKGKNREYFLEACGCLRHFPMDYRIEDKWKDDIE
jgi:hypothetical protein